MQLGQKTVECIVEWFLDAACEWVWWAGAKERCDDYDYGQRCLLRREGREGKSRETLRFPRILCSPRASAEPSPTTKYKPDCDHVDDGEHSEPQPISFISIASYRRLCLRRSLAHVWQPSRRHSTGNRRLHYPRSLPVRQASQLVLSGFSSVSSSL